MEIEYEWTLDNNVASRVVIDHLKEMSFAWSFTYDNRDRLVGESLATREFGVEPWQLISDIEYVYDQLGNRMTKTDAEAETYTIYYYDIPYEGEFEDHYAEPHQDYMTQNNRLVRYEEYDDSGQDPELTRTVWYVYYKTGNVSNIVVKDEYQGSGTESDFDWYRDLAFYYTTSGQVWQVLWDRWLPDSQWTPVAGELPPFSEEQGDYERLAAREFRYDAPRARYLSRLIDPDTFLPDALATWEWTDYDGVQPYGDFTVDLNGEDEPEATNVTRFLGGLGTIAHQTVAGGALQYHHGDLIRSTVAASDNAGDPNETTAYTAFGESISGASGPPWDECNSRYAYAGGWGYESGLLSLNGVEGSAPITLQHLGARWYQSDTGRFVQRDPIGLTGGKNLYVAVGASPISSVDPSGFDRYYVRPGGHSEVWIDDGRGGYIGCDFGPLAGSKKMGLIPTPGLINMVSYGASALPSNAIRHVSTPEQDAEDIARIAHQQHSPPMFWLVGQNCIGWASFWAEVHDPPTEPGPPFDLTTMPHEGGKNGRPTVYY